MVNRYYQIVVVAGMFALLAVLPGGIDRVRAETEVPAGETPATPPAKIGPLSSAQAGPDKRKVTRTKAAKRQRQPDSHFVSLSRLLMGDLGGHPPLAGVAAVAANGFDPENIDFILGATTSQWVLGPSVALADQDLVLLKTSITLGTPAPQPLPLGRSPRYSGKKILAVNSISVSGESNRDPFEGTELVADDLLGLATEFNTRQDQDADTARNPSGSPFAYRYQRENMAVKAGFSWVEDLADTNPSPRPFKEAGLPLTADQVSVLNFNLGARYRAFSLNGGYTRALDRFAPAQLFPDEGRSEPGAWNSELAYTTELLRKETVLAVGYQKSSEALQAYLPEQRYSTKASVSLFERTTLSLEYYLDKEKGPDQRSGAEENGYGITTRIGFGL